MAAPSSEDVRPGPTSAAPWLFQVADVRSLRALLALRHLEPHALVFSQRLEARALDFLEVGEEVLAAAIRGDEAKALAFVLQ
jgi:hypothetical protein